MKFLYEPAFLGASGMFECPECKVRTYQGGPFYHNKGCSMQALEDYEDTTYVFGPDTVKAVMLKAETFGEYSCFEGVICLADLRREYPELVN